MKRLWQIHLWFALLTIVTSAHAAEALRQHYLFVVDTSRNMAPLAASARNAVYDLLDSGIQGQIQPSDTFEVWMFDADVRTNSFPRRLWVAGSNNANALQAADLLRKQSHNRAANFANAAEAIGAAIRAQPVSTVFIITDGRTALTNLPFATAVNNIYREHSATLRGELRPFITTLVADSGQWVAWSVGSGGRQLEIPRITLPPPKPEKPPATVAQTPPPKKAVVEETKPTPQPVPVVTTPTPAPTPVVAESKPVTPTSIEPAKPVTPVVVEPKSETTPAPIVTPTTSPAPAPTPALPPREEAKPVVEEKPVAKPEPAPPVTFAPAPVETAKPAATPPPAPTKAEPIPSVTPPPTSAVVEAPKPEPKPSAPTAATTAVITPISPKSAANNSFLWVAIGLIGLAGVLLFLYLRPKPRTKGASLITRSLNRPEE